MPTLYMTQPGSRLELEAGRLISTVKGEVVLAVPATRVDQVVLVTGCHVTTPVLSFLLDQQIDMVFLSASGRFRGRLDTGIPGSLDTRLRQYQLATNASNSLELGKAFITGKIHNARARCMELDAGSDFEDAEAIATLKDSLSKLPAVTSLSSLMGIEGAASRVYFGVLGRHLREPWAFNGRKRRPPPDPVNAVLSILYTLLHEQCRSALVIAGLDPVCGFLHQPRPGRASLALDLMEEFRPIIADAVAWTLFNKRILSPADFSGMTADGVRLRPGGWQRLAIQYQRRLDTGILLPGRKTRTTYRKLLEVQARQLARVVRGDKDFYEPFRSR